MELDRRDVVLGNRDTDTVDLRDVTSSLLQVLGEDLSQPLAAPCLYGQDKLSE